MKAQDLAVAVSYWLTFEHLCQRSNLFDESYLAYPIGHYLHAAAKTPIEPEYRHPLSASGAQGRPKQIDFVVKAEAGAKIALALETKFINNKRKYEGEVLSDILRLEYVSKEFPDSECWLLVAGKYSDMDPWMFNNPHDGLDYDEDKRPFLDSVLIQNLGDPARVIDIEHSTSTGETRWIDRAIEKPQLPKKIRVQLKGKAPNGAYVAGSQWACFIWKISAVAQRTRFSIP